MLAVSLAAAAVAVVAAGVTAFLVLQPDGNEQDIPGIEGSATDVVLADEGDQIKLTWQDPSEGQAQPVIWGHREDQAPHNFGMPQKGIEEITLFSLNRRYNYCFSITLVYSAEDIRQSEQVCTKRQSPSPAPSP
jgi:hypothetical protein